MTFSTCIHCSRMYDSNNDIGHAHSLLLNLLYFQSQGRSHPTSSARPAGPRHITGCCAISLSVSTGADKTSFRFHPFSVERDDYYLQQTARGLCTHPNTHAPGAQPPGRSRGERGHCHVIKRRSTRRGSAVDRTCAQSEARGPHHTPFTGYQYVHDLLLTMNDEVPSPWRLSLPGHSHGTDRPSHTA